MSLTRSQMMGRVRNRDTAPELKLRSALWATGLRYRVRPSIERIRPDLAFLGSRLVVFVDGCFWHGCPAHYALPNTSQDFWRAKLSINFQRDSRQTIKLEAAGWRVLRVWEHELTTNIGSVVAQIWQAVENPGIRFGPDWRVFRVEDCPSDSGCEEIRHLAQLRNPSVHRVVEGVRITGKGKLSSTVKIDPKY